MRNKICLFIILFHKYGRIILNMTYKKLLKYVYIIKIIKINKIRSLIKN